MKTKTKNIFKSALSLTLALIMVLGVAPLSELAGADWAGLFAPKAEAATSGIYTYEIANGKATITDCDTSASGAITIPSTLGGYPVTTIGQDAFRGCSSLTSVTIPDSVTSIGDGSFKDCQSLTSVTIQGGVTSIGNYAFEGCSSLINATIPDSVTSIGYNVFWGCRKLTNVTIPNSMISIGDGAFYWCTSLTSVVIPDSVTSIGKDTFHSCQNLISVTIPESVTSIGNSAFANCSNLADVYYIGTEGEWKSISIGSSNEPLLNATIHYNSSSTDDKSFNQPVYIADIWSGSRNEETPEHKSLQWYYNDYTPITKSIVDELEKNNKFKNAVNTWNGVKMITSPSSGTKTELNKEQQCEVLIFDVIRDILGSTDYSDIISTSSAEDLVNWTKSLNGAAKSIYDAEGIENFEDFYNKYGKKLDGKKKTKALVEKAYELHQEDVGAVSALDDVLKYVDLALDVVDSGEKFINSFVNCLMAARMSESLKSVLSEMYAQPGISSEMKTALSEIKTACESQENALTKVASDFVTVNGVKVFGKLADEIWGEMISAVPGVGTLYQMIEIGTDIGEGVSNMLFSTGSTIDNYYLAKSTVELVNIAKKASLSLQSKFLSNKNKNTANPYIDSVRFYVSALSVDAESGRKFCDTACNDGLINGVSNWLNGGNAKYDEIERSTESIKKSNKQFISFMSISWIFADNYLKKDYPAIYDIMVKNILTNPDYSSTITQVKIGFDGKAVVYFNVPSYVSGFKAVSGVEIYYKKNNGSYSLLSSTNPYSKYVSHNITLSNTDTYSYKVRAYTTLSSGQKAYSDFSNEFTVVANPAETPQIQCAVGATGVNIIIKDELVSSGFSSYQSGAITSVEIYRRRQGESSGTRIKTISVDFGRPHLYTDTNPGTSKCYYSARTVITYNGKTYYSKYSPEMSAIMLNDVPQNTKININIKPGRSLPKTRTMTVGETSDCLSVELNWNKIDGVTEYEICRKLSCGTSYVSVGTVNGETTSFVDTTVSEAGTYDYIVRFYRNMNGEKVLCGESQSASVLIERVANQTETVTIKNGQTTNLSINSGNLSDGSTVSWSTSSDCVTLTPSEDGTSCGVKAVSEGNATVTVTITHKDGSTVSDTFDVEAKRKGVLATIFDIILSPFRLIISLFKLIIGLFK